MLNGYYFNVQKVTKNIPFLPDYQMCKLIREKTINIIIKYILCIPN